MLIEIPVLYRATVVLPGRRKEIDCLLSADVPLRIASGTPAEAMSLTLSDMPGVSRRVAWFDHEGTLMGSLSEIVQVRQNRRGGGRILGGEDLLKHLRGVEVMPVDQPRGHPPRLGRYASSEDTMPFLCRSATVRGPATPPMEEGTPMLDGGPMLPIIAETEEFRSCVQASPGFRDIAIAHAQRLSRTALIDERTGELLLPSPGPIVLAHSRAPRIVSHLQKSEVSIHAYRGEDLDEAMAFCTDLHRGLPVRAPRETLEVYRPGLSTWNSAGSCIATMAAGFGMQRRSHDDSSRLHAMGVPGMNLSNTNQTVLLKAVCDERTVAERNRFRDTRNPSEDTVALARSLVERVVELQQGFAAAEPSHGISLDATTIWAMSRLLERLDHTPAPAAAIGHEAALEGPALR